MDALDKREQMRAISSRAFDLMRDNEDGPLGDKISGADMKRGGEILTLPFLVEATLQAALLGKVVQKDSASIYVQSILSWDNPREAVADIAELIQSFLDLFRLANPQRWDAGRTARFPTNVGVSALIRLIGDLVSFMAIKEGQDPRSLHPKSIVECIEKYAAPCVWYFKTTPDEDLSLKFSVPFGSGGPRVFQHRLRELVRSGFNDFSPPGFEEDLRKYDADRRRLADEKIRLIQQHVQQRVVDKIRHLYPEPTEDASLRKAVENKEILKRAFEKQIETEESGRKDLGTYLDFIDLRKIVESSKNWDHFKAEFSIQLPDEQKGKAKYLGWFDQINKLRRVSAHPYNRGYDDHEIERVDLVFKALSDRGIIGKAI